MRWVVLLIASVLSFSAHAEIDGVVVWKPLSNGVKFILPKIHNTSPSEFVRKYAEALKSSPVYASMEDTQSLSFSSDAKTFEELPESSAEHPNVAVVLNRPAQMGNGRTFLVVATEAFEREGPRLFSIPIGLETVLSAHDMQEFRTYLNSMDGQLGMGGDDVHPALYGRRDLGKALGDLSIERDREIIAYFREYLKNGKGRVFYICGALQRAAVMDGRELYDDILHLTDDEHRYLNGRFAAVEVLAEAGSELEAAVGNQPFKTSNAHHSAVNPLSAYSSEIVPSFKVSAYNIERNGLPGKIVKALDFPGNAGFGTQFHPEVGTDAAQRRIVEYVAMGWKLRARVSSQVIVECMKSTLNNRLSTE